MPIAVGGIYFETLEFSLECLRITLRTFTFKYNKTKSHETHAKSCNH